MANDPLINVDTARTLAHVALLAAWEGDNEAAECIFDALQAAKPKEPNIRVCRAMVYACRDKYSEAIVMLRAVLKEQPDNVGAKGLLGFVMFSAGEYGWQAILEEVIASGGDQGSTKLAHRVLSEHRAFEKTDNSIDPAMPASFMPYV